MILEFQRNNNIKYINKKKEEVYIYRERERWSQTTLDFEGGGGVDIS